MSDYHGHFTREESETFLKGDLRCLAEELSLAYALKGMAQEDALDMAAKVAEQASIWYQGNENLNGIEQALVVLALRMTRREKSSGLNWVDVPLLSDVVDKALEINPRRYLSQYSEEVAAFFHAFGELEESWQL